MKILTLNTREHKNIEVLARHFSLVEGIEVISWNPQIKSAFDAFDEYKPDILLFHSSLTGLIKKVQLAFPETKFVCEDNSANDTNEFNLTFTTVINNDFKNKKYVYIGYDLASLINRTDKQIYQTDICFHGNLNNQQNMDQFQELVNPIADVRINGRIKFYGIGHTGEFACGVLSDVDQFAAYSQAKVSVVLKNWFDSEAYEAPITLINSLKVNVKTIHNIPELKSEGYYVEDKKSLLETVQGLMENNKTIQEYIDSEVYYRKDTKAAFSGCRSIFQNLQLDTSEIDKKDSILIERYSL